MSRMKSRKNATAPKARKTFRVVVSPKPRKSWLMAGTALTAGVVVALGGMVAMPRQALADCSLTGNDVNCNPGGTEDGYSEVGVVVDRRIYVHPGTNEVGGINLGTSKNVWVDVYGADNGLDAAKVSGGTTHGFNIVTSGGFIDFSAETDTVITGGTGSQDGMRLRTATSDGYILMNLSGNVTAGTNMGEAIDAQATGGGTVTMNLMDGTYTGTKSEVVVLAGGIVGVTVDDGVALTGGNDTGDHGIWVLQSSEADIDFAGSIDVAGNGLHVGFDGGVSAGAATGTADIVLGATSNIVGGANGAFVDADGNTTVTNWGHLEGEGGAGLRVTSTGGAQGSTVFNNHSYQSTIGDIGSFIDFEDYVQVNNAGGTIAGLTEDGLRIEEISGDAAVAGVAVEVNNSAGYVTKDKVETKLGGGVIAGADDGLYIDDVWDGDVVVNNNGYVSDGQDFSGGLIAGVDDDGIDIRFADGNVFINNQNTRFGSIDLSQLDDRVFDGVGGGLLGGFLKGGYTTGIWGDDNGVQIDDVNDLVAISNQAGVIVGIDNDGVHVEEADGGDIADYKGLQTSGYGDESRVAFFIANGIGANAAGTELGGVIWGDDDGIDLDDMDGSVIVENRRGTIFGGDEGVNVNDVYEGNVIVRNDGGLIRGLYGDAINIQEVDREDGFGGGVFVRNGAITDGVTTSKGGWIVGGDSAIQIDDARTVDIVNARGGVIIGDGDSQWQAVIRIDDSTSNGMLLAPANNVVNDGVMASRRLEGFSYGPWSMPEASQFTMPGLSLDTLETDLMGFGEYVRYGTGTIAGLSDYEDAAEDHLMRTDDGGATRVLNTGFMAGRINLDGRNGSFSTGIGNTIDNYGAWFVQGDNELSGSRNDAINNHGWIQTAFQGWNDEDTEFEVNDFHMHSMGILSMVDGGDDDRTTVRGNFHGGGHVAMDVDFDDLEADLLRIRDGEITGQTEMIFRKIGGGHAQFGDEIDVVDYDDDETLPADSAFKISSMSDHYIEMGDVPFIEDGLLAWYLQNDTGREEFELVATAGPGALNAPGLITGAQTIFYETLSVVEDHIYGGQFQGPGGGGADLPMEALPVETAAPAGPRSALWIKGSGSWVERDTTVTLEDPAATVDTGSDQNIYSILGGADFKPGGADSDFRIGIFGGYVTSDLDFSLVGTDADYQGGTVGAYAAYNNGGFYADVTVKGDFLDANYEFAGEKVQADVGSIGVAANTGYRMYMGAAFLEPILSAAYVHTEVDDFDAFQGTVSFDDGTSIRAGAGARVGTSFLTGSAVTELSLLGKVWNEFEDSNTVVVTAGGSTFTAEDDIEGVFGEVAATATVKSLSNGLSGFVSANGKFGDEFTSYGASAGVRLGF